MDKYTKFILTIIAVGIVAINIQYFKNDFISHANAGIENIFWRDLARDRDFVRAVEDVVESCDVEGDEISC